MAVRPFPKTEHPPQFELLQKMQQLTSLLILLIASDNFTDNPKVAICIYRYILIFAV